jgi:WD40 repeat protein
VKEIFKGPEIGCVWSVVFSPDGKSLVLGCGDPNPKGKDGSIIFWDVATAKVRTTSKGHTYDVKTVALSRDGKSLASASAGPFQPGELKLWDAENGKESFVLKGHGTVFSVAFSPDGKTLASASLESGTVKLWEVATGKQKRSLHATSVSVAYGADDSMIAMASSRGKSAFLWDMAMNKPRRYFEAHPNEVVSAAISEDGKTFASGCRTGTVKIFDAVTGKELSSRKGHETEVWGLTFSKDGKTLASACGNLLGKRAGDVKIWDVESGKELAHLKGYTRGVFAVAFSPDGKYLATGSGCMGGEPGEMKLWSLERAK